MDKKRLPKSIRKRIRDEKARIRRSFLTSQEQDKRIKELYQRLEIREGKEYYKDDEAERKKQKSIPKSNNGKNGVSKSS